MPGRALAVPASVPQAATTLASSGSYGQAEQNFVRSGFAV